MDGFDGGDYYLNKVIRKKFLKKDDIYHRAKVWVNVVCKCRPAKSYIYVRQSIYSVCNKHGSRIATSRVEPGLQMDFRLAPGYLPRPPQWHSDTVGVRETLSQARDPDILGQMSGTVGFQRAKVSVERRVTLTLAWSGLRSTKVTLGKQSL